MKIVLAKLHDSARQVTLTAVQYPLNIGYLAAVCMERGHEVRMWDFCVESFDDDALEQKFAGFRPDVLGLSCVTPAIYHGDRLARFAKRFDPKILTVLGGVHVSALPRETLVEFSSFDLGVIGEAEEILPEILEAVAAGRAPVGISGTVFRAEEGAIRLAASRAFPDVNRIPFPARDLIPASLYGDKHSIRGFSRKFWNIAEIDSSRGCPFSCTFCGVEITHGHGVRFRTPENVLAEIEVCRRRYRTNFIVFNDSTFTLNARRVKAIVEELPRLGIEGYLVNSHVNCVSREMLEVLARTGCRKIVFGIESGSDRVLKKIRKNSTRKRSIESFALARRSGIPIVEAVFILGADVHETIEDFRETESLIRILNPDILGLGIITPFPGTEQYSEMKRLGYLEKILWDRFQIFSETPPPWRIVNFSAEELVFHRNRILKSFYWNPSYIWRRLRAIRSAGELWYYAKMALAFFRIVVRGGHKP
jgi:radical SAM superfamily enzyme YgiQ (UPF0313 family)